MFVFATGKGSNKNSLYLALPCPPYFSFVDTVEPAGFVWGLARREESEYFWERPQLTWGWELKS